MISMSIFLLSTSIHDSFQCAVIKLTKLFYMMQKQRDYRDCSVFCVTETWLDPLVPDNQFYARFDMQNNISITVKTSMPPPPSPHYNWKSKVRECKAPLQGQTVLFFISITFYFFITMYFCCSVVRKTERLFEGVSVKVCLCACICLCVCVLISDIDLFYVL